MLVFAKEDFEIRKHLKDSSDFLCMIRKRLVRRICECEVNFDVTEDTPISGHEETAVPPQHSADREGGSERDSSEENNVQ